MDSTYDVPDPSDWLGTPVSSIAPVENALRCQVCKDFFTTPVITSCSHTFCSLCIRRCLTNDGKCPSCRTVDQELRLRPNWIVQELVESFQAARAEVLKLGREARDWEQRGKEGEGVGRKKRKFQDVDAEVDEDGNEERRRTRASRRRTRSQVVSEKEVDVESSAEKVQEPPDDGLAACPICGERMKEEAVFAHLDVHDESNNRSKSQAKTSNTSIQTKDLTLKPRTQPKPMARMPQLNYSLLNDNALRKKLEGMGIPNNGPRALLIRRHTEWVNLVNANCDSKAPRSKRELLHELDTWERSQGRQIQNGTSSGSSSVMDKDFDGAAWISKHDNDFQKLIADAKKRAKAREKAPDQSEERGSPDRLGGEADEGRIQVNGIGSGLSSPDKLGEKGAMEEIPNSSLEDSKDTVEAIVIE